MCEVGRLSVWGRPEEGGGGSPAAPQEGCSKQPSNFSAGFRSRHILGGTRREGTLSNSLHAYMFFPLLHMENALHCFLMLCIHACIFLDALLACMHAIARAEGRRGLHARLSKPLTSKSMHNNYFPLKDRSPPSHADQRHILSLSLHKKIPSPPQTWTTPKQPPSPR